MNALVEIEQINPLQLFTQDGVDPLIEKITGEVRAFQPDISTAGGRKEVASLAHKVARSKTLLDDLGKNLVADWKQKAREVDAGRKKLRDSLDELKIEARKPLTDWETIEERRVSGHRDRIHRIKEISKNLDGLNSDELCSIVKALEIICDDYEEFQYEAEVARQTSYAIVEPAYQRALEREKEQAELARLRRENEEREAKERQEQEDRERKEAAERREKERLEAARQAEQDAKERAEREAEEEKKRRIESENLRRLEAEAAEKRRIESEQRIREDERIRLETQKKKEAEAKRKKSEDLKHRKKINNTVLASLREWVAMDEQTAMDIVDVIARGEIPHLTIKY